MMAGGDPGHPHDVFLAQPQAQAPQQPPPRKYTLRERHVAPVLFEVGGNRSNQGGSSSSASHMMMMPNQNQNQKLNVNGHENVDAACRRRPQHGVSELPTTSAHGTESGS